MAAGKLVLVIESKARSGATEWIARWYATPAETSPARRIGTRSPYNDILAWINQGKDVAALVKPSESVRLLQLRRMAEVHSLNVEEHSFS